MPELWFPTPSPRPCLFVAGLGMRPPEQICLETALELSRCDRIHALRTSRASLALLRRLGPPVSAAPPGPSLAGDIASGKSVGIAVDGSPLFFEPSLRAILLEFRERGLPWRLLASVSPLDQALADLGRSLGYDVMGLQACARDAASRPDFKPHPRLPLAEFFRNGAAPELALSLPKGKEYPPAFFAKRPRLPAPPRGLRKPAGGWAARRAHLEADEDLPFPFHSLSHEDILELESSRFPELAAARENSGAQALLWRAAEAVELGENPLDLIAEAAASPDAGELSWACLLRAARRAAPPERERLLAASNGGSAAARALSAALLIAEGRQEEGLAALERLVRRSRAPWTLALRGAVLRTLRACAAALEDLDAALKKSPSPASYLERALVLKMFGFYKEALVTAEEAGSAGGDPALLASFKARVHLELGRRGEARRLFAEAASLLPGSPTLLAQSGAWNEALSAAPGHPALMKERALHLGKGPGGTALFRARRYRAAAAAFARERRGAAPPAEREAEALGLISRLLAAPVPRRPARMIICGFGPWIPYYATLESVRAMAGCGVVFHNFPGELHIQRFLRLLCPDLRALKHDLEASVDEMMDCLESGKRVGFATRAHPLVYGDPARRILRRLKGRKLSCGILPSVSAMDLAGPIDPAALPLPGWQVFDQGALERGEAWSARLPTVIFLSSPRGLKPLCRRLAALYPAGHQALIGDSPGDAAPVPVERLEERCAGGGRRMIFLPAA